MDINQARKALEVISYYGQFQPGQDGYAGLKILREFIDEVEQEGTVRLEAHTKS